VGQWKVTEADRKHRWRNHYFLVPARSSQRDGGESPAKAVSAERDINMFQLCFSAGVDGHWGRDSLGDTITTWCPLPLRRESRVSTESSTASLPFLKPRQD